MVVEELLSGLAPPKKKEEATERTFEEPLRIARVTILQESTTTIMKQTREKHFLTLTLDDFTTSA